ncbi:MAG: thiamine diphosphokinase [Spirochaetota bacterium]
MNAVVITGGEAPGAEYLVGTLAEADLVVAADSGLDTARRLGARPEIIVGDFDSLSNESLLDDYPDATVRRHPTAKDFTDTELALEAAWEAGATRVTLVGGGGGRMDHLLAIVAIFERARRPDVWITGGEVVTTVERETVVRGRRGEIVSLFPLGCVPCTMSSRGRRWELDEVCFERGDAGVSNELDAAEAHIRVERGRLLMIRPIGDA